MVAQGECPPETAGIPVLRLFQRTEENIMSDRPMPAGDPVPTAPPPPGKTQPLPPEMPSTPIPEVVPPAPPSHPSGPPAPTA
jgi:hypothetical protein